MDDVSSASADASPPRRAAHPPTSRSLSSSSYSSHASKTDSCETAGSAEVANSATANLVSAALTEYLDRVDVSSECFSKRLKHAVHELIDGSLISSSCPHIVEGQHGRGFSLCQNKSSEEEEQALDHSRCKCCSTHPPTQQLHPPPQTLSLLLASSVIHSVEAGLFGEEEADKKHSSSLLVPHPPSHVVPIFQNSEGSSSSSPNTILGHASSYHHQRPSTLLPTTTNTIPREMGPLERGGTNAAVAFIAAVKQGLQNSRGGAVCDVKALQLLDTSVVLIEWLEVLLSASESLRQPLRDLLLRNSPPRHQMTPSSHTPATEVSPSEILFQEEGEGEGFACDPAVIGADSAQSGVGSCSTIDNQREDSFSPIHRVQTTTTSSSYHNPFISTDDREESTSDDDGGEERRGSAWMMSPPPPPQTNSKTSGDSFLIQQDRTATYDANNASNDDNNTSSSGESPCDGNRDTNKPTAIGLQGACVPVSSFLVPPTAVGVGDPRSLIAAQNVRATSLSFTSAGTLEVQNSSSSSRCHPPRPAVSFTLPTPSVDETPLATAAGAAKTATNSASRRVSRLEFNSLGGCDGSTTFNLADKSVASLSDAAVALFSAIAKHSVDEVGMKMLNQYVVLDTLGRGAYGTVKLAFSVERNISVAIKITHRSAKSAALVAQSNPYSSTTHDDDENNTSNRQPQRLHQSADVIRELAFRREIAIMKTLRHKNIVQLYEVIDDPQSDKLYFVMQFADQGCVGKILTDGKTCEPRLPLETLLSVGRQVAAGMSYLHQHGIAHRDIKPENLLMTSDGRVLLSDFGVSAVTLKRIDDDDTFSKDSDDHQEIFHIAKLDCDGNKTTSQQENAQASPRRQQTRPSVASSHSSSCGVVAGTPLFLAPETHCFASSKFRPTTTTTTTTAAKRHSAATRSRAKQLHDAGNPVCEEAEADPGDVDAKGRGPNDSRLENVGLSASPLSCYDSPQDCQGVKSSTSSTSSLSEMSVEDEKEENDRCHNEEEEETLRHHILEAADVWAFGVTIFSLAFGEVPFPSSQHLRARAESLILRRRDDETSFCGQHGTPSGNLAIENSDEDAMNDDDALSASHETRLCEQLQCLLHEEYLSPLRRKCISEVINGRNGVGGTSAARRLQEIWRGVLRLVSNMLTVDVAHRPSADAIHRSFKGLERAFRKEMRNS